VDNTTLFTIISHDFSHSYRQNKRSECCTGWSREI